MSDDDERDPFEHLDSIETPDGDPFEQLDEPGDGDGDGDGDGGESESESAGLADLFAGDDGESVPDDYGLPEPGDEDAAFESEGPLPSIDGAGQDVDDPLADVGDRGDPFEGGESVFEQVDVGSIDEDEVWAEITDDSDDGEPTSGASPYDDVSKHKYCEQCPHFSAPPEVHCTNDGTEIVEFLDMETVRLSNCPIVAEQREIEEEG